MWRKMRLDLHTVAADEGVVQATSKATERTFLGEFDMNTMLKTQLVAIAAATLGLTAAGCGGGSASGDSAGAEETGGGEASCSGSGEASCSGATEGTDMAIEGDAAGAEGACGAGSCGEAGGDDAVE